MQIPLCSICSVKYPRRVIIKYLLISTTILLIIFSFVLFGAGQFGFTLNEQKLAEPQKIALQKELVAKLESGDIIPDKELTIMFVKNSREIEESTTALVGSIFENISNAGVFLFILLCFHSVFIFKVLRSSKGT